ncbi:MAG: MFS transporter, partial [Thermoanaerobaculia bacterium]|nr:MFS transporter [Thermoanaerobaculia bacterium]
MSTTQTREALDTSATRWWILFFLSVVMFGNYYVYDSIGPLADHLQRLLGYSDTQIGTLNAIYSFPNIFLVLVGGLLVDKFGAARVTLGTTIICLAGALLTAVSGSFVMMAAGRLLFGIGAETMIVAATVALGLWFLGRSMALAMALNLSLARAGSYTADVSPVWARGAYDAGWQDPLWIAAAFAALSFVGALAYWIIDRREAGRRALATTSTEAAAPVERIVWGDVLRFDRSYWYVVGLCVTFYSVILPFRSTFAIKYFQHAHGLSLESASVMNSYVFLAAVFVSPLFGGLADRYGRRASFMIFGSLLLPATFLLLGLGQADLWIVTALVGVSFSLVPAILWPAVAHVVTPARLGTAFGLMTMLQNIGLTGSNVIVGRLNDASGASATNPAGYQSMLIYFGVLSLVAMIFAVLL